MYETCASVLVGKECAGTSLLMKREEISADDEAYNSFQAQLKRRI
jgi:hypothetical protein